MSDDSEPEAAMEPLAMPAPVARTVAATLLLAIALPLPLAAQDAPFEGPADAFLEPGAASGIDVIRGAGDPVLLTETRIDPTGLSAPVTISRGRAPAVQPTAIAECACPPALQVVPVVVGRVPRPYRTVHHVWWDWTRAYWLAEQRRRHLAVVTWAAPVYRFTAW